MRFSVEEDRAGNRVYTVVVADNDLKVPTLDAADRELLAQCAKEPLDSAKMWGLALLMRRVEQAAEKTSGKAPPSAARL